MLTLRQEYLGDWGSLMGHQQAARELITRLYTPETISRTEKGRKIFQWSLRFDMYATICTGKTTSYGMDWIRAGNKAYSKLCEKNPTDLGLRIEEICSDHRVLRSEMSELFLKFSKGEMSLADFMKENEDLTPKIRSSSSVIDPFYSMDEHVFTPPEAAYPDDIGDPYKKPKFFTGPLWSLNYLIKDCLTLNASHIHQISLILQQPPPPDLAPLAIAQCQIIEAIHEWPDSPNGAALATQASVGFCCLHIPRSERNVEWGLSKLAKIETLGYVCFFELGFL